MSAELTEARFRELLDEGGVLRPGALAPPVTQTAFLVFAQRADAGLDLGALRQSATRFFDTRIGFTVDKRYGESAPRVDAVRVVVAPSDGLASGTRLCFGRPTEPDDLARVEAAERAAGRHGMGLLAQRCPHVWLIETEEGDDDRVALTLAAIFASVLLGPIVPPRADDVYGVRTARAKLEERARPYR